MGFSKETMMLRAPGGQGAGFVIWERGTRQAILRCNLDGLPPDAALKLFWMAEGGFALRGGVALQADGAGAVRHALPMPGDAPPAAVALTQGDGGLYAHAFGRGAPAEVANAPERLRALLLELAAVGRGDLDAPPHRSENAPLSQCDGASGRRALQEHGGVASWRAAPWPPPPGLPGTVWRDGCWVLPV